MFDMSKVVTSITEVPETWIYQHFYKKAAAMRENRSDTINQPFDGRIIKMRSLQNRDTNPSLCFYYKKGKYLWKDFSSGSGGDAIKFVETHFSKYYSSAVELITHEYGKYLDSGGSFQEPVDIEVVENKFSIKQETWSTDYLAFWSQFRISKETLSNFNVVPVSRYSITRIVKGKDENSVEFTGTYYAYLSNEYGVAQIYRPNTNILKPASGPKYITVEPRYMLGRDQLAFKHKTCIIVSGLKDLMAIYELGLSAEYVAGRSESALLLPEEMEFLKSKYDHILTFMDNDKAGIKSMLRYETIYKLPYIRVVDLDNDLAKNNKIHDLNYLKGKYSLLINKKIQL
jgi:hypothetical protein